MKRIALIAIALAASTSALAHDSGYDRQARIEAREARQIDRIYRARQRGELTWYESWGLRAEQARIRRMERNALRDGYLNTYEARRIEEAQDRASRHIYNESHDGQRASWRRW